MPLVAPTPPAELGAEQPADCMWSAAEDAERDAATACSLMLAAARLA